MFKRLIIILGIFAQFAVPTWLIAKQQLILRHGEEVDVKVNVYDPRDFLAGHYVQLSPSGDIPAALENVPTDYLRYYCDQRYAKGIEELVRKQNQKAVLS
ncbi:MAG: GDYXXLXY domain-containing protein, partial [Kiritimatiellia bacterium]